MELDTTLPMPLSRIHSTQAEFERLVDAHRRRILALAWRLTGNLQDAEDVTQDVFLKLHRHLRDLEADSVLPWLRRVTANACTDVVRRRRGGMESLPEDMPAGGPNAEQRLLDLQREQKLARALLQLGERERTALVLRDLESLSTGEVAEAMGTTEGTVRVQIMKARLKLRELLRGEV